MLNKNPTTAAFTGSVTLTLAGMEII